MARSNAERLRASRLRARPSLTPDERRWLAAYDAGAELPNAAASTPNAAKTPQKRAAAVELYPSTPAETPPASAQPPPQAAAPDASTGLVDFGAAAAPPPPPPPPLPPVQPSQAIALPHEACAIKDCPECKRTAGAMVCGTTGKPVYPPMSAEGAEGLAFGVLNLIGLVVSFYRPDKRIIAPSRDEAKRLGAALREMAFRRASVIGAFDDIFATVMGASTYAMRALKEPAPAPQKAAATS